jgi:hypothetical protein
LFHHEHDKPMTEAEREALLTTGTATRGMVLGNEPSAADRRVSLVRVCVDFRDGPRVEFSQELASLYQPEPGSPEARRLAEARAAQGIAHPDRVPKIQLPLFGGEMVPVRYDAANRGRAVIDVPELRKRALHDYIKREQQPKDASSGKAGARSGPPWAVPAHCPNCGAPVDQARASHDRDPLCEFCRQPVPVMPLR